MVEVAGTVTAVVGGGTAAGYAGRSLWRGLRRVSAVIDLLGGRPPRFEGDPEARPSLPEHLAGIDARLARGDRRFDEIGARLAGIAKELHPNGGSSLRDQVDALTRAARAKESAPLGSSEKGSS